MKKAIKNVMLPLFVFGFFLLFNSGLKFDDWSSISQTLVFTLSTLLLINKPWLKNVFVILSLVLFIFTGIFFTLDLILIAEFFGSLGFGILIISGIFYSPQLLKHGYI